MPADKNMVGPPAKKRGRPASNGIGSVSNPKLTFKSPAEFFAENKNIAGFDNPGKSLYTTVRELVENGLDAAEAVPVTPDIDVLISCVGKEEFRKLVGMDGSRERVDNTLYKDVETEKERRQRQARERREAKRLAADLKKKRPLESAEALADIEKASGGLELPLGGSSQPGSQNGSQSQSQQQSQCQQNPHVPTSLKTARAGGSEIFCVTVCDNGTGMAHDDVPNMMGRVLTGTKYCVRQSRGKFGLGSKMALIWSKMSTGLPVKIRTAQAGCDITTCVLDIDMAKNVPKVISHTREPNLKRWRGSEVSVTIQGSWTSYRAKLLSYMRQMAVITSYAEFKFAFKADPSREDRNFEMLFARRTDTMPRASREVKHHPSSVDQYQLKRIIAEVRPSMTMHNFLVTQFVSITTTLATRLLAELGPDFSRSMPVKDLEINHIRQLHALLQAARFEKPDGECLSPAGEYNLRLGITKELRPTMIATHAEPADVFEGHAFVVEAGVALGGVGLKPGLNIYRFANRIPLLFEGGNDVVTKTAKESIRWNNYKISPVSDRVGVICSIVSTKIPFKGTGKEYIADDADTIKEAVKRAITQCCSQLKSKLVRRAAVKDAADRKKLILRYVPDVANAITKVFTETTDDVDPEARDVADMFKDKRITNDKLSTKLLQFVDQFDKEQALEYASAAGRDDRTSQNVFFAPRASGADYMTIPAPKQSADPEDGAVANAPPEFCLLKSLQATI